MTKPTRLEKFSAPILLFIHGLPRFVFPVFTAALLLIGLFSANQILGGIFLLFVGIIIGWLVTLSWKLLPVGARFIRLALVIMIFGYAIGRLTGRIA
ncbi:MAG: hypothetical protein RIS43_1073 [Actinomycetota bacterium]|jgi:hypothetical protein